MIARHPAPSSPRFPRVARRVLMSCGLALALCACAAPTPVSFDDPHETRNRKVYAFNLGFDSNVVKPLASGLTDAGPGPVIKGISNFSDNLVQPTAIVNSLLQGRIVEAGDHLTRFFVNSTVGLAGFLDPATSMGIPDRSTDFGETLHVWGVGEGNYVVLPLSGPSTERDAAGIIVDAVIDPMNFVNGISAVVTIGSRLVSRLSDRGKYSDTIDSILYDSADGYLQLRLLYLEQRRFELGQSGGTENFEDPYEDPYGQ